MLQRLLCEPSVCRMWYRGCSHSNWRLVSDCRWVVKPVGVPLVASEIWFGVCALWVGSLGVALVGRCWEMCVSLLT